MRGHKKLAGGKECLKKEKERKILFVINYLYGGALCERAQCLQSLEEKDPLEQKFQAVSR